ncbi:ABC transporter permease [Phytoactinopolyspora alkaliphila]|uniref:ABC transporter permease n=2 Tax=Phytoactinopolyspora alkaliphila TaxID=1783498 RepID=A0A6N9YIS5_9ACTN|nr:ABC transporter permease [Phytoactinopolyspora alkaliphila]
MGFRRWSTYRLATAAGAFTNSVFGLIKAYITIGAIGAAGGSLAGYDAATGATYAWLVQALIAPVNIFGWQELALRIRSGDVAVDLARPVDPQLAYLAADLGRAAYSFIPRGAPPLLVGAAVTGLTLPTSPLPYVLGAISVWLAVMLSFACQWLVNLAAFWLLDLRGVRTLYMAVSSVLSGMMVPVHWFPGWLSTVAAWTPGPSLIQAPIDVVTARADGVDALAIMGTQAVWLVAMLAVGQLVFLAGTRKLVVQGG